MRVDSITGKPLRWTVANGNEIHDRVTEFDEHGTRISGTANRIAIVEYPYGDPAGKHAIACKMAAAEDMESALLFALEKFGTMPEMTMGQARAIEEMRAALHRAQGKA